MEILSELNNVMTVTILILMDVQIQVKLPQDLPAQVLLQFVYNIVETGKNILLKDVMTEILITMTDVLLLVL